jgi:hypothetical protein
VTLTTRRAASRPDVSIVAVSDPRRTTAVRLSVPPRAPRPRQSSTPTIAITTTPSAMITFRRVVLDFFKERTPSWTQELSRNHRLRRRTQL